MDQEALAVLLDATSASELLHSLYLLQKAKDRKRSLAFLCRKAGMTSTGYLSDVFTGKRSLHPRYRDGLVKALGLKDAAADCAKLLIDLDHHKLAKEDSKEAAALSRRLKLIRRVLRASSRSSAELNGLFSALEVFCAFGLFGNTPTKKQLLAYFSSERRVEVEKSLETLTALGLIAAAPGNAYHLLANEVFFGADGVNFSHIEFLKLAMAHAAANFETWFANKKLASFTSSFISVNAADYERKLAELNTSLRLAQNELESEPADMLLRFNVQIYPVAAPIGQLPR